MTGVIYINEEEGIKRVMNNSKLYVKLLTKFKTDTNLNDLLTSVEAQDWEKAHAAAHTIKGVAANLSLTELYNQSFEMEKLVKGKAVKPELLENIKLCFTETLAAVEKVIAKYV